MRDSIQQKKVFINFTHKFCTVNSKKSKMTMAPVEQFLPNVDRHHFMSQCTKTYRFINILCIRSRITLVTKCSLHTYIHTGIEENESIIGIYQTYKCIKCLRKQFFIKLAKKVVRFRTGHTYGRGQV